MGAGAVANRRERGSLRSDSGPGESEPTQAERPLPVAAGLCQWRAAWPCASWLMVLLVVLVADFGRSANPTPSRTRLKLIPSLRTSLPVAG